MQFIKSILNILHVNPILIINLLFERLGRLCIKRNTAENITHLCLTHFKLHYSNSTRVSSQVKGKPYSIKTETNRIRSIFDSVTTKHFTKILSTVDNLLRTTKRKRVIRIRKLSLNRGQLVYFHFQFISLHRPKHHQLQIKRS